MAKARIPIAGSIPGRVLEERAPRRVHDLHPSLMARPGDQDAGVTALLVPLALSAAAPSACSSRSTRSAATPASATKTRACCSPSPPAPPPPSPPRSRSPKTAPAKRIAATERERGRWARELHDESLQSLAGLRVLLSAARRSEPEELDGLLVQGIEQIDGAIAEMRRLIADLRPSTLDQLGLGAALEALGERTASGSEVAIEVDLDLDFRGRAQREPPASARSRTPSTGWSRRRSTTPSTTARPSASQSRSARAARRCGCASPTTGKASIPSARTDGFGLIGMRERAELAGGTLELQQRPRRGHDDRRRHPHRLPRRAKAA